MWKMIGNYEHNVQLHPDDVLQFTDATAIEMEQFDHFQQQHNLTYFRQYFPPSTYSWHWPISMDNMIMQWHSICRAWQLMRAREQHLGHTYDRIGLFRIDMLFVKRVRMDKSDAVTALYNR